MMSSESNTPVSSPSARRSVTKGGARRTIEFSVKGLILGVCITPVASLMWMLIYFGLGYYSRYALSEAAISGIWMGLVSGVFIGALRLRPLSAALWNMMGWVLFKGGGRWWKIYTGDITYVSAESLRNSVLLFISFVVFSTASSGWLISKTLWDWLKEKES